MALVSSHTYLLVRLSDLTFLCSCCPLSTGLFARGVARLEQYPFILKVGGDILESGSGPGSYDVKGNVFHFNQDWLNPEIKTNGWAMLAAAVVGWSNNGSILSILAYCTYWIVVSASLVSMKWKEGRFGREWATPPAGLVKRRPSQVLRRVSSEGGQVRLSTEGDALLEEEEQLRRD